MSEIFQATEQFKALFQLDENQEYIEFTPYKDQIGFSVQRCYPANGKYKPPVLENGEPDTFAMIGVLYNLKKVKSDKPYLVPISVRISLFSRFISKHDDYDFSNKNECPTEESVLASKNSKRPIDLSNLSDISYDHTNDTFVNSKGERQSGIQIFEQLYSDHIATISTLRGLIFRVRLSSIYRIPRALESLSDLTTFTLRVFCGRTLQYSAEDMGRGFWKPYLKEDMKLLSTEKIDILGFSASKHVITVFSIILLAGYSALSLTGIKPALLKNIVKYNLLSIAFAVVSIGLLDFILPLFLLKIVNFLIKKRMKYTFVNVPFRRVK